MIILSNLFAIVIKKGYITTVVKETKSPDINEMNCLKILLKKFCLTINTNFQKHDSITVQQFKLWNVKYI